MPTTATRAPAASNSAVLSAAAAPAPMTRLFAIALLGEHPDTVTLAGMAHNLLWVTLANAVAGAVFMAGGYWTASRPLDAAAPITPVLAPPAAPARQ